MQAARVGHVALYWKIKGESRIEWLQIITKANTLGGHLGLKYF